ncbi:MAG: CDP-diacylglycerol--serine O-phosphatidyltransferase [Bacteroidales bacterium]|nr:CDP-diacylglycerol--serine O-phosphatidyltransferase [Bacteroidales bacterium]
MSFKKHIPNAITSLNLVCGVIGIILTLHYHNPCLAFIFMLAAVVFDFCDGLAARMLGAYSELGKELDSLSDLVSFGVLPSVMMFYSCNGHFLAWACLLLAAFSALRLAKFNLDDRQHESFIGLPTPSAALLCGSFCSIISKLSVPCPAWLILAVVLVLCYLLVCELPMFSFKFGKGIEADTITRMKRHAFLSISAIIVIIVAVLALPWEAIITGVLLVYILENSLCALFRV